MNANRPMVFVTDEILLDDLLKLSAAASCDLERVPDAHAARQGWLEAPLILLDQAAVRDCLPHDMPPRKNVVVVAHDPEPPELWKDAMQLGADKVITLPGADPWLIDAMADAAEGPASKTGGVLAVMGARGGAGASVFSVAVSLTALKAGKNTLLIDCDPKGGGLDVVMGAETEEGLRWPDIHLSAGRVAAKALHESLPTRRHGKARLSLLSGARVGEGPAPDAVAAIIEAGRRTGDVVVCDVPRHLEPAAWAALNKADLTVIVTPAELRAAVTARQLAQELRNRNGNPQLVVRVPSPGGLLPYEITATAGVPLLAMMRPEPNMARSLELGTFRLRPNGPLAQAARETLIELAAAAATRHHGNEGQLRAAS